MATKQLPEFRSGSLPRTTRSTSPPARRKNIALSPLALKMQADLELAGLGERTQESYLRSVLQAGGLTAISRWLSAATPPVRSLAQLGIGENNTRPALPPVADASRECLNRRSQTPRDDAEGSNPHN